MIEILSFSYKLAYNYPHRISITFKLSEKRYMQSHINLILIQQSHRAPEDIKIDFDLERYQQDPKMQEIIYSQLKIMQVLSSLKDAAVLVEGCASDVTSLHLKRQTTKTLQMIFPKNMQSVDFNSLSNNQAIVLWQNLGPQLLFHMGLIPAIYQTTARKVAPESVVLYNESFKKNLFSYPTLLIKAIGKDELPPYQMPSEKKIYSEFYKEVIEKNPKIFYEREKEALDFALIAAHKSGKKLVALIFGKDHLYGISKLINTEYKDRIVLKEVIDTTEGFICKTREEHLKKLSTEGSLAYKDKQYDLAVEHFQDLVTFWKATPDSTPKKLLSLCTTEFNLGSALLKRSEEKGTDCEDALIHLDQANILSKKDKEKNAKYHTRYLEANKRHQIISFFSENSWKTSREIILDYANENINSPLKTQS